MIQASIILVTYNSRRYLSGCLGSLLSSLSLDCELILLDNASTDGGVDFIKTHYPEVILLCASTNLGFARGNNLAAKVARGKYLVFLNPDTTVEAGWLSAMIAGLENNPNAGLSTSQILLMAEPGTINTCGNEIHLSGLTLCRGAGMARGKQPAQALINAVSGAAFAIRKELFETLGGFDESFFLYLEDTDLSWRARLAGYDCLFIPGSIVYHDYRLRINPHKIYYQERNRYQMLIKNLHWGSLLALLPAMLLAEMVTWGFVMTLEPIFWGQKIKAYTWVMQHWHEILARRKVTQAHRICSDRQMLRSHTWRLAFEQAGSGIKTTLAHLFFEPLFWVLKGMTYLFIWW